MSMFMFCAAPQMVEPMAKNVMKVKSIVLRPKLDARSPTSGMKAVEAMVYALPTHIKSVPWRWSTIVGSAVGMAIWRRFEGHGGF